MFFLLFVCCIRVRVFCIHIIFALESLKYAVAPFHVFNFLKFRQFFCAEPNLALESLPNVGSNIQGTSNNTPRLSLYLSNNLDKKDGKEHFDVFEPLEKKPKRSYKKTCVFQDTWACHFPWAKSIVGGNGLVI